MCSSIRSLWTTLSWHRNRSTTQNKGQRPNRAHCFIPTELRSWWLWDYLFCAFFFSFVSPAKNKNRWTAFCKNSSHSNRETIFSCCLYTLYNIISNTIRALLIFHNSAVLLILLLNHNICSPGVLFCWFYFCFSPSRNKKQQNCLKAIWN